MKIVNEERLATNIYLPAKFLFQGSVIVNEVYLGAWWLITKENSY
jgi:hypothetical protein